ncbi:MAG TPA: HAD-IB family phosphatase [Parachlamydiaceae bacterium]|nr:HAD-IB family phosphatase [Parachlamydiaceae bacterium]
MQKISLFDLDHTLLSANSSFLFGSYLHKRGVFKTNKWLKLACLYFLHKLNFITLFQLQAKAFQDFFLGRKADSLISHRDAFISHHLKKHLYTPSIERLEKAKKQGHHVYILSNSPDFIVAPIAAYFGVENWKSTIYALNEKGEFSFISSFFEGNDKADCLKKILASFNLEKENSIAYSDSILDRAFLEAAGKAVAVNPDKKLKQLAVQNNWEII